MKIKIRQKLAPFSHTPGTGCLIPGTFLRVEAFPTLLRIAEKEFFLPLTGPVKEFTLQQDLERHCVYVFGRAREGYFKFKIEAHDSGVQVLAEKGGLKSFQVAQDLPFVPKAPFERLSLGGHKAQDWDLLQKRSDLKEILPIFFCLGQKVPLSPPQPLKGTARLLEMPSDRNQLAVHLESLFKAAFNQILVPRLNDDQHQGLVPEEFVSGDPNFILSEGFRRVRALFFEQNERRLSLLPRLPIPFDAGRLLGLKAPGIGEIDLEWSKKILQRVILRASTSGEVIFELQKGIKKFRVEKKKWQERDEPLLLETGKTYFLDRFEK